MNRLSQTMRIDIPPDLKDDLRRGTRQVRTASQTSKIEMESPSPGENHRVGDSDFQELLQSVYDAALIANLDGGIVDANTRATEFLRLSHRELCSQNLVAIISGADSNTLQTLHTSVENDRFVLIQAHCTRKDGSLFPAEIAVNRLHVRGKLYFCCFIRDVTLRQQAEDMLRTVHNAIRNASTGIVISNLEGQLKYVNKATLTLWEVAAEEDLLSCDLKTLIPDTRQVEAMIATVHAGQDWSGETVIQRKDGSALAVQVSAAGNRDADGELVGMVFSFLDLSDRKRAEEAEKHAERQRVMVESIGAACHHLGQPATVILTSLELLLRQPAHDGPLSTSELLNSSMEAAESLRTMLHRLNDISEYQTDSYIDAKLDSGYSESRIVSVGQETI
jgi:two-component system cell cycle sensor histidine kinase/response regulator CckA